MKELLEQLAAIDSQLEKLLANDDLTDEQRTEHDKLVADRKKVRNRITAEEGRLERVADREALEAKQAADIAKANRTIPAEPRRTDADVPIITPSKVRKDEEGRVTSFMEETDEEIALRFGETRDAVMQLPYRKQKAANHAELRRLGYKPRSEFRSMADFVRAGFEGGSSFRDRCGRQMAVLGQSEGIGSEGGYLVMPEFAGGIIDRVYDNPLWGMTDNYTVSGNNITFLVTAETSRATGSRAGGIRGYYVSEGSTITASKTTLREVTLKLIKVGAVVYLTNELIADGGSALQQYVTRKVSEEFRFMQGDGLVNGTGTAQPLGMLNFPSLISVSAEGGQLADTLEMENIEKMAARFYMPNWGKAVWLHNQDIGPELNTMTLGVGTGGVPVFLPPGGLSQAPYGMLKGRPLQPTEFNPTLGDVGDLLLADMSNILSISKGGVGQAMSMHVQFLTDQLALRFIIRYNAGPWESAPITPYKGTANTQSNFVALAAR